MMAIPIVIGIGIAGPAPVHIPLTLAWLAAFMAFQAGSVWLKSRRKARFRTPVLTYAAIAVPPGLVLLVMRPELLWWGIPFAPLVTIAIWAAWTRNDRGLANDIATILATSLMIPVAFHAVHPPDDASWPWVWIVTAVVAAAFLGTIPHVKALIRERTNPAYARFSIGYHTALAATIVILTALGVFERALLGGWVLALTWILLAARAYWMPRHQQQVALYTPIQIGVVELVLSLLLAVSVL